jgi:type IV pilus assembly protein PilO
MGNFASGIAALPRIVTLHDIEIAPGGKDAGAGNLVLNVTAKTYRYLDEDEGGAEGGKAKKPAAGE